MREYVPKSYIRLRILVLTFSIFDTGTRQNFEYLSGLSQVGLILSKTIYLLKSLPKPVGYL